MHENSAMRPNALLPADISDTFFDTLTEALCMLQVPVIADGDGPDMQGRPVRALCDA